MALGISKAFARWFRKGPSAEEKRLLVRARGDRELVERLIGHELAKRPDLSRAAAAESALHRWMNER